MANQETAATAFVSPNEDIEMLGLTIRTVNALKRGSVYTVLDLVDVIEKGEVSRIRGIGKTCISDLWYSFAHAKFVDRQGDLTRARMSAVLRLLNDLVSSTSPVPPSLRADPKGLPPELPSARQSAAFRTASTRLSSGSSIPDRVLKWQAGLIKKQLSAGLLHERAKIAAKPIEFWLSAIGDHDPDLLYEVMARILGASLNVCEELESLLASKSSAAIPVLLSRYGFEHKTLKELGSELGGVTRQRVDQIWHGLRKRVETDAGRAIKADAFARPGHRQTALLRTQSALLIAESMGDSLTYSSWEQRIRLSGLVGSWTSSSFKEYNPIEMVISVANLLDKKETQELRLPPNLRDAVDLAAQGKPGAPVRFVRASRDLSKEAKSLIRKHARRSGAVNAKWLSNEIRMDYGEATDALEGLGFRPVSENWFALVTQSETDEPGEAITFDRLIRKMTACCGRLPVDDICSGIRASVADIGFPVPPPDVMAEILQLRGYRFEKGAYFADESMGEPPSNGELVVLESIASHGKLVHSTDLAQAFTAKELSVPLIYQILRNSVLFEKVDEGLYKLRGVPVTRDEIEAAKAAVERIPVNAEIHYDKKGWITLSLNLGALAANTGSVSCAELTPLRGSWDCTTEGEQFEALEISPNTLRGLKGPLEYLGCKPGDRIKLTFDTWRRSVTIERLGEADAAR